jgi:hypothetical protein
LSVAVKLPSVDVCAGGGTGLVTSFSVPLGIEEECWSMSSVGGDCTGSLAGDAVLSFSSRVDIVIPAAWVCACSGAGDVGLADMDGADVDCVKEGAAGSPHRLLE